MDSLLAARIWKVSRTCRAKVLGIQSKLIVPAAHLHNIIDGGNYLVCDNGSESFTWPSGFARRKTWMEGLFSWFNFVCENVRAGWKHWFTLYWNVWRSQTLRTFTSKRYIAVGIQQRVLMYSAPETKCESATLTTRIHLQNSAFIKAARKSALTCSVIFLVSWGN